MKLITVTIALVVAMTSERLPSAQARTPVYSYTVVHRPQQPAFTVPYIVVIALLEEGWHMLSNLIDCDPADVAIGMPIEVVFREMSDAITLPYFRPQASRSEPQASEVHEAGGER